MEEAWRPVVGYEGLYDVSDHGRIRSHDRMMLRRDGKPLRCKGRILTLFIRNKKAGKPYLSVNLIDRNGVQVTVNVHAVVAEAWIGPRPPGMEVLHRNDIHSDNRPTSLRYGTRIENEREKKRRTMCRKGLHVLPETDGPRRCNPCYRDWYERTKAA